MILYENFYKFESILRQKSSDFPSLILYMMSRYFIVSSISVIYDFDTDLNQA